MNMGNGKGVGSSVIIVVVTIILALAVLGFGLGMMHQAKPIRSVSDIISNAWEMFNGSENENQGASITCLSDQSSPEYTFVVIEQKVDNKNEKKSHEIETKWRCDVPGGEGSCIIKNTQASGRVLTGMSHGETSALKTEIYKGFDSTSPDFTNSVKDQPKCEYKGVHNCIYSLSSPVENNYFSGQNLFFKYKISSHYSGIFGETYTNFTYYYCCPEDWEWNKNLNVCCPIDKTEEDCKKEYGNINNFTEYCANSEKVPGKSLLEKIGCSVSSTGCQKDRISDGISSDCTSIPLKIYYLYSDPYQNVNNDITICLDQSGDCKRSNIETGQCLRLNFKDFYGKSVYVKDLWFRSGSDDGHNDLYVFGCYDGSCNNNGDGWHTIAEDVEGYNVLNHIFVDKKLDMIDICPKRDSKDHKIAWVKFTTNESLTKPPCQPEQICVQHGLENGGTTCYVGEDGKAYLLNCADTNGDGCVESVGPIQQCAYGCNNDNSGCAQKPADPCDAACKHLNANSYGACRNTITTPNPQCVAGPLSILDTCISYKQLPFYFDTTGNNFGCGDASSSACYCIRSEFCPSCSQVSGLCTNEGCLKTICLNPNITKIKGGCRSTTCENDITIDQDCNDDNCIRRYCSDWQDSDYLCLDMKGSSTQTGRCNAYYSSAGLKDYFVAQCIKIDLESNPMYIYSLKMRYSATDSFTNPNIDIYPFVCYVGDDCSKLGLGNVLMNGHDYYTVNSISYPEEITFNGFDTSRKVKRIDICPNYWNGNGFNLKIDWIKAVVVSNPWE
ncbi:MAG: hypothetical protein J7K87_03295 [Candidatus Aenigmarchaeota archaeon]|nr:hypothetical protein [Candidatus Aenigmarchaeota archaeon]